MTEATQEAFDRGHAAGKRDARLDGHDDQLDNLDTALSSLSDQVRALGSDLTTSINGLMLQVQKLALNAKSSAETAIALAEGVEKERSNAAAAILKEKNEEKDKEEKFWTPITRFVAMFVGGATVVGVIVAAVGLYIQSRA